MQFQIDFCDNYFLIETSGPISTNGARDMLDAIFTDDRWRPGMAYVVDHTKLDVSKLTNDDLRQIAQITKSRRSKAGVTKSSIVAPNDLEFGLSRMWAVYDGNDHNIDTSVFRTRKEAIAWVLN